VLFTLLIETATQTGKKSVLKLRFKVQTTNGMVCLPNLVKAKSVLLIRLITIVFPVVVRPSFFVWLGILLQAKAMSTGAAG